MDMKRAEVVVLFLFIFLGSVLSGCTNTPPKDNETDGGTNGKFYDSQLIGLWRNPRTLEVLEFRPDGIYSITEAEMEEWYTQPGGILWMYGTQYTYSFSENNTVLGITEVINGEPGYTRTFQKI
jgi:hypothetical protein